MSYNTDRSGSTLTDIEMSEEAERILRRLRDKDLSSQTTQARTFVAAQIENMDLLGGTLVSVKQLWWLRKINEEVD
jgi:hypothetical protein